MWSRFSLVVLAPLVGSTAAYAQCKATPGSPGWPSLAEWASLNQTLSGRLLKTNPPGAVCHSDQPTFNPATCPAVQEGWLKAEWHSTDPVSSLWNNWNNDTCLPIPTLPCSPLGYPVYVVNATCAEDVKKGVDFARKNNVRLIVKGTGHDYLGRSSAPNSLSIWTHHMGGISFHNGFTPKACRFSIDTYAMTAAAGTQMLELDYAASLRNLTIMSGGSGNVGVGGYLTGGGHGALTSTYGLAADQVLEIELVTPGGQIVTANECQNEDLFWAMRGGGGSTFGVLTSVTFKAFPSSEFAAVNVIVSAYSGNESFWNVVASILSQFPALEAQGISGYFFVAPSRNYSIANTTISVDGLVLTFLLPILYASNSSNSLSAAVTYVINNATAPYPLQFSITANSSLYPDFFSWYLSNNGPPNAGTDDSLGSRLLDVRALTQNITALKEACKVSIPPGSASVIHLVSGRGVWNAVPRGGSDAVNPAWRKSLVHYVVFADWAPFDEATMKMQQSLVTNTWVAALRKLAPDTGAYINEADPNEPNFQRAFWGTNYPRLLAIKRAVDPNDVLWCHPCVGNERWEVVGDQLCRLE